MKAYNETYDEKKTEEPEHDSSKWQDSFWSEQFEEDSEVEGETEDGEAVQLQEAGAADDNSQGDTHNARPVRQRKAPGHLQDYTW